MTRSIQHLCWLMKLFTFRKSLFSILLLGNTFLFACVSLFTSSIASFQFRHLSLLRTFATSRGLTTVHPGWPPSWLGASGAVPPRKHRLLPWNLCMQSCSLLPNKVTGCEKVRETWEWLGERADFTQGPQVAWTPQRDVGGALWLYSHVNNAQCVKTTHRSFPQQFWQGSA